MIAAIMWKEWREQRTIALAVLAFGILAIALTAQFADANALSSESVSPSALLDGAGPRELMAPALVFLAGIVCGAILLADEKEVGTFEFLDSLPCDRRSLWIGKSVFGVLLTCVECWFFAGLALALQCAPPGVPVVSYGVALTFVGLLAFAWGIFGGAIARSTLGAVFQGAVGLFVAGLLLAVPAALIVGPRLRGMRFAVVSLVELILWLGVGLAMSVVIFTALDRRRNLRPATAYAGGNGEVVRSRRFRFGLFALAWLSVRQAVFVMMGAAAAGLVLGAVMLAPESQPFLIWPSATLALGVLAGVTTFSEEQTRGIARYWAERRLPLGRMWAVKCACQFTIAMLAALIMFLPIYATSPGVPFRTRLFNDPDGGLRAELFRFIWIGLVYGFATGHLAGMLFRKTVVAGLVSVVTAATLVAMIAPSVLSGGAASWQVWGPAAMLLAISRLLLYPWATERVFTWGPIRRVVTGAGLTAALVVGGALYRIYEIPDVSDRLAESGFEARIPTREGTDRVRSAVLRYRKSADEARELFPSSQPPRMAAVAAPAGGPRMAGPDDRELLERLVRTGSIEESKLLWKWLDQVFNDNWPALLDELDGKPLGLFEDPRDLDYFTPDDNPRLMREMMLVLRARGMQRQAEGDPAVFARFIPGALAACRSAKQLSGWRTPMVGLQGEELLLEGLNDWLAELDGRDDLLRTLLAALIFHEKEMPVGVEDAFWADRIILRNTLQRVGTWLPMELDHPKPARGDKPSPAAEAAAEVIGIAWNVPWERVRRERILRVATHSDMQVDLGWLSGVHLRHRWRPDRRNRLGDLDQRGLTLRRAACLQVAVRLFQLEHREPLRDLSQLVPEYLPELPNDPYSGRSFGYRLSTAEVVEIDGSGGGSQLGLAQSMGLEFVVSFARFDGGARAFENMVRIAVSQNTPSGPVGVQMMRMTFGPPPVPVNPKNLTVAAGSSIIWSIGRDGKDNDGRRTARRGVMTSQGQDWVFVVPLPRGRGE